MSEKLKRLGLNIKHEYHKITTFKSGKKLSENFKSLKDNKLVAVVYNFVDMISHAKTEMDVVKELASNDKSYRSLTLSWFKNSPLLEVIQEAQQLGFKLIITTDHGNANPGVIYGKEANKNFDSLQYFKHSNDFVLQSLTEKTSVAECQDIFKTTQQIQLNTDDAQQLLTYYQKAESENGVYNYKKLPFKALADIQKKQTSVGWISMDHSADYTELAMFGPGSENLKPFIKNTDLHYFMLNAAEVENKF